MSYRRNIDLHMPFQTDDLIESSYSYTDRKYDSSKSHESSKFELMKQDLSKATEAISSLRKERDALREALKTSFSEKDYIEKHLRERLQSFEAEIINGRKAIRLTEELKVKSEALQEELKKLKKMNHEKSKILNEQESRIRELTEALKMQVNGWEQLQAANQALRKELVSSNYVKEAERKFEDESLGVLGKIMQYVNYIIEKVHHSPSVYTMFKSRVTCSKKLREAIEKQEFPDVLLKMMKFIVDLINYYGIRKNSPLRNFHHAKISKIERSKEEATNTLYDCDSYYINSPRARAASLDQNKQISDKFIQTQTDRTFNTLISSHYPSLAEKYEPSFKDEDEYSKLIGESQQLLSVLDKQNSRLALLNQQISTAVTHSPKETIETEDFSYDPPLSSRGKWDKNKPAIKEDRLKRRKNNDKSLSRSKSPESQRLPSRFEEYVIPNLKKTERWDGVADFFSSYSDPKSPRNLTSPGSPK
ncbi:unnamed protein product [Blepharisma stoltei]|uniref:Uncharacterized protein n=1 Tax=Blepharisma stoltei TaxID=1481888 RepID=A0AAU9JZ04_9CILI|nr:unnamed protein product [Blepharisma stoltei]